MQPAVTRALIGIDIGGTKTLGVALSDTGEVLGKIWEPTRAGVDIASHAVEMYHALREQVTGSGVTISSLGIGIAGLVDVGGRLHRAPNLVDADGLEICQLVEPEVDVPVHVDNDVNCAALAEIESGAAVGAPNALLVTLGTGIGGALIVEGGVHRGAFGMAGEPGHMVIEPNGLLCACGMKGCWEAYGSATGLRNLAIRRAKDGALEEISDAIQGDFEQIRSEDVTRTANQGDLQSLAVVDEFARWVALGLANCAALLDPELIIVGGGLTSDWHLFGQKVEDSFRELLVASGQRSLIPVKPAENGEEAGALGACLLGRTS